MKITTSSSGNFSNLERWADKITSDDFSSILKKEAPHGLNEFARQTPKKTGKTAGSYGYEIEKSAKGISLIYTNTNVTNTGVPLPILIDNGHGTGTGGYVPPRPFINKIVKGISERISDEVERKLKSNG